MNKNFGPFIKECGIVKTYKKGQIIYHEGSKPEGLYCITSGIVGLVNILPNGEESLLRVFGPNNFFGHRTMLANETYHSTTIALDETRLCFVSKERFYEIIHKQPDILLKMTEILAKELKAAELRLRDSTGKKAQTRIIESLVYLKTKHPNHRWTRKEIGEYSGTKTETVARVLSLLEKENLIKKIGRNILIESTEDLLNYASSFI
ncbi:MAG: Crp/Fnr family transcriptional regulator [Halobacteriovoraceae bacterium]|nr:Crp/Fnr family transcriptional regulator [Halobacteriovoraceae bacterium]